jgi:hypothetical protein
MFTLFDTPKQLAYHVDYHGANRTCRPMAPEEVTTCSTPLSTDFQYRTFFYVDGFNQAHRFQISNPTPDLHSLVNAWNVPFVMQQPQAPPVFMIPFLHEQLGVSILLRNFAGYPIQLWDDAHFLCEVPHDMDILLPLNYFENPGASHNGNSNTPILVPEDIAIFTISAFLYRRNDKGYYQRDETLLLRAGIYPNLSVLVASLNAGITMRGERNGYIYHFLERNGKLSIMASHRQPDPSYIEIAPCNVNLGLAAKETMPLRTNKRLDFCGTMPHVIA